MPRETEAAREFRVARRRAAILDSAAACFAETGYERASMRQVADRAGVAAGSLYNYFADKSELLLGLLDRLHRVERSKIAYGQRPPEDLGDFLERYFEHRIGILWSQRCLLRAVLPQLLVDEQLRRRYCEAVLTPMLAEGVRSFEQHAAAGRARPLSPELVVRTVAALVLGVLTSALLEDRRPEAGLALHLAAVVVDGIGVRTG